MTKEETVTKLEKDHQELEVEIARFSLDEIGQIKATDKWSLKDLISHLTAWNWEDMHGITSIINDEKPNMVNIPTDEFNEEEVSKRKKNTPLDVLTEWQDSFDALIMHMQIEALSDEEWAHSCGYTWEDGGEITPGSLFEYEYEGTWHESGHLKQIKELKSLY